MKKTPVANKIVIVGVNNHNTLGLIRSIGECGYRPDVVLEPCDLRFCNLRFSKYIDNLSILECVDRLSDFLIAKYKNRPNKTIVLCGSDFSACNIDTNLDRLQDDFQVFNIDGRRGMINRYMDKLATFPLADKCGFTIIKTWNIKGTGEIPADISYPCLIKGNNSTHSSKEDIFVCNNKNELQFHLNPHLDYLIQEYIDKDAEYCVVGVSFHHGREMYSAGVVQKLRESFTTQSDYITLNPPQILPNEIWDSIHKFISEIRYEGIFSLELLRKDSIYYFLELNMRNDGTGYLYTAAKANYPMAWVSYCLSRKNFDTAQLPMVGRTYSLMQIADVANIFRGKVSIMKWVVQFLRVDAYFTLNMRDPLPFIYQLYIPFRQAAKKIIRKLCRNVNVLQ